MTHRIRNSRPATWTILALLVLGNMEGWSETSAANAREARAVETSLREFLTDFENLDWEHFRAHFSDHACVFFPSATTPETFCGREAFEQRFRREFESIRGEASSGPPFMRLHPDRLNIEMLGGSVAVVTFELHNAIRVGRRTVIFRREGRTWRIVHLHASNVPWPDEPK